MWLKLPLEAHGLVSSAVSFGFGFHHATSDYLQLTRWLPTDVPSPLPRYAFTLIGVGGVVLNGEDKVLMVQERVSPSPRMQGSWKLPGGLADPGEDFAQTVAREVREEVGVDAELEGVVSMRHSHGRRFGQGDLYVLVRLRTVTDDTIVLDREELADARWMSLSEIQAIIEQPEDKGKNLKGKVSLGNFEMIENAMNGQLIEAVSIPNSKGQSTMIYRGRRGAE